MTATSATARSRPADGASRPYTAAMTGEGAARTERCTVALSKAFAILGKRWNGVIIGALSVGPAGFAELSRAIGAISDSMLSDRLSELVAVGVLSRDVASGPPVTVTYALTDAGRALDPILADLEGWVRDHLSPEAATVGETVAPAR